MATLSRVKTWIAGDVLTASDLNAEFNNIVNDYNGNITNANLSALTIIPMGASLEFQNSGTAWFKISNTGNVTFYA